MKARTPTSACGSSRTGSRARGLTLIELLVVLALIVILSAALVPALGGFARSNRLKAAARDLVAQARFARELAVRNNRHARLQVDTQAQLSRVQELAQDPTGGSAANATGSSAGSRQASHDPEWQDAKSLLGKAHTLPDGVRFARAAAQNQAGGQSVIFAPDGSGEEWIVVLADRADQRLAVKVDAVTGSAKVLSPADGQAWDELERATEALP